MPCRCEAEGLLCAPQHGAGQGWTEITKVGGFKVDMRETVFVLACLFATHQSGCCQDCRN